MRHSRSATTDAYSTVEFSTAPTPGPTDFLRLPAVMKRTGLGRSTIYRLMAEKKFPPRVLLAKRAIAWRASDVDRWSAARPTVAH